MARRMRVKCQKDDTGRLNWLEIYPRGARKPLRLDYVWDSDHLTREIEFSGAKRYMPSISDVMMMFSESFIERIGLVKLINLIEKIETIDELTLLKTLQTIQTVEKIESVKIIGKDASNIERRSTISNNGTTALWGTMTGDNRASKFFTRGCMGFINTIDIYCKSVGVAGTITVYISPNLALGYVAAKNITVGAGVGADWRSATFNRMWLSDKLFIFILCSSADIKFGNDMEDHTKDDAYNSTDAGATWTHADNRTWIRVIMKGETEGHGHVAGTVNTIEIPHRSSEEELTVTPVPAGLSELIKVEGSGELQRLIFNIAHSNLGFILECDGLQSEYFYVPTLSLYGFTPTTPAIQLLRYTADSDCTVQYVVNLEWKKKFRVVVNNFTGGNVDASGRLIYKVT